MYTSSVVSGEIAHMRNLARAFATRLCDKNQILCAVLNIDLRLGLMEGLVCLPRLGVTFR